MRKVSLPVIYIFAVLAITSCGDDDPGVDPNIEIANAQNLTEERSIPVSELSQGVSISGGTKQSGSAPAPTGTLDFQIGSNSQEAFQGTGFDITFSSNDDIAGAYIQLLDVDGTKVEGYFDVPADKFSTNGRRGPGTKSSSVGRRTAEGDLLINVDFDQVIEPGQFCYEICIYDAIGNISVVEQVCVEVEAWGGNASIVGEWIFDRSAPDDEDNDLTTVECQGGQLLQDVLYSKVLRDDWIFVLNADGSYYEEYFVEEEILDEQQSSATCTAVYAEATVTEDDTYLGFWAFNETDETLTVVDFEHQDRLDPNNNEVYDDGQLYFEGVKAEVINGELVLTEVDIEDGVEVEYKVFFKRK